MAKNTRNLTISSVGKQTQNLSGKKTTQNLFPMTEIMTTIN